MATEQIRCPSCQVVIRFRAGLPDRDWIECPRCGDEIHLDELGPDDLENFDDESEPPPPPERRPPQRRQPPPRRPAPQRERPTPSRPEGSGSSKTGLWIGLGAGAFGLICLVVALLVVFNQGQADDDQPPAGVVADRNAPPTTVVPLPPDVAPDQVPPDVVPTPPAQPQPQPQPAPEGVIPAPPGPKVVAVDADLERLRYGWQPGQEYAYRIRVTADLGDQMEEVNGQCIYSASEHHGPLANLGAADTGTGTGFVLSADGYLATCAHVIEDASKIEVRLGGRKYEATLVASDPQKDLAIIRIAANNLPVLPLGDSDRVQLAENVRVVGYPLTDALGQNVKITQGTIAGFIDRKNGRTFQVDASINPGNSGGPLVNGRGEVVGVASAKLVGHDVSNVGFAVPAKDVRDLAARNGIALGGQGAAAELDGPELARRVTPPTALLTVTIGPGQSKRVLLKYNGHFTATKRPNGNRGVFLGPPQFPRHESDRGEIVVDEFGQLLDPGESETVPYIIEPLAHVMIEPLPRHGQTTWESEQLSTLSRVQRQDNDPFGGRFGPRMRPRFGPDPFGSREKITHYTAAERKEYRLSETTAEHFTIRRDYNLRTTDDDDHPFLHLTGQGTIRINRHTLLPDRIDYQMLLQLNEENRSQRVPVTVECSRLTEAELAEQKQKSQEAMEKAQRDAEERKQKENSPETLAEHIRTIQELTQQNEFSRRFTTLHALGRMNPADHAASQKDVIAALLPLLTDANSSIQNTALKTFAHWAGPNEQETLIGLIDSKDIFGRGAVIAALGRIGGKRAAEAIAVRLSENQDRHAAKKALIEIGADAEEAVLKVAEDPDTRTRSEAYAVLGKIAGEKGRALLEKRSSEDPDFAARLAAGRALKEANK